MKRTYVPVLFTVVVISLFANTGCDVVNDLIGKKRSGSSRLAEDKPALSPEEVRAVEGSGPVLVRINGKPVVYRDEFISFCEQAIKANPYLTTFGIKSYESAPPQVQEQLIEAMVHQKLISLWGEKEKITDNAEYKETLAKMFEQVKQMLIAQTFEKRIFDTVVASDDEIEKEYEKTKDRLIKEPGSMKVIGVAFDAEEKASSVAQQIEKDANALLTDIAKAADGTIEELGSLPLDPRLAANSKIAAPLRGALFALAPEARVAQAEYEGKYWVLVVEGRTEPLYYSFDEVKGQLESMVRSEKFKAERDKQLQELRGSYTVDIDASVLGGSTSPEPEAEQQGAEEEERPVTTNA